jgi:hypothetical protein
MGPVLRSFATGCALAPQPPEEGAFEQLAVEPVGLGAPVLTRYGDARCVNDMGFNVAQPSQKTSA